MDAAPAPPTSPRRKGALRIGDPGRTLFGVAQAVLPMLRAADAPRVLMVAGVAGGEGASTVARNVAHLIAAEFDRPVCLVRLIPDAEAPRPNGADAAHAVERIQAETEGGGELLILGLTRRVLGGLIEGGLRANLQRVTQHADLFVVDAPPVLAALDATRLCCEADGVLLVVEAERTPLSDVEAARDAIEAGGGRLIGAVLNKRRHRLPGVLARLFGGVFRPRVRRPPALAAPDPPP